jgi:hypothetical protein
MRFGENRKIACAVLVVCIIASLLMGGGALMKQRTALLTQYNASAYSISAELLEMRANAVRLQGIASKYDAADSSLTAALSNAVAALDAADDVQAQYAASLLLQSAVERCYANLTSLTLSAADTSDARYAYKNFSSAQLRISHDSYNELAAAFNAQLSQFPANVIGALRGVKPLQLFGAAALQ